MHEGESVHVGLGPRVISALVSQKFFALLLRRSDFLDSVEGKILSFISASASDSIYLIAYIISVPRIFATGIKSCRTLK